MQHPILESTKDFRPRMTLTASRSTCKQTRTPGILLSEGSRKKTPDKKLFAFPMNKDDTDEDVKKKMIDREVIC
ncbi:uncharacterized protein BO95DRAFT_441953, partial [Aspergillus brunneoviolaceus CBS 621.78]